MTMPCPCCGSALPPSLVGVEYLLQIPLPPRELAFLKALTAVHPRPCTKEYLFEAMYGDRPDGGPLSGGRIVITYAYALRKALAAYGWTIPLIYGSGGQGRYRLVRLNPSKTRGDE